MKQKQIDISELATLFLKYGVPREGSQLKTLQLLADYGRTDYTPTDAECAKYPDLVAFMQGILEEVN